MSLKGVKKAFKRAPHQLIGRKSIEDKIVVQWDNDLSTAISGLNFLASQTAKYKKSCITLLEDQFNLSLLIEEIESEPDVLLEDLQEFKDIMTKLKDDIDYKFELLDNTISYRCKELIPALENYQKMLKKRSHKKMDYDIHNNNVQKMISKKSSFTDKDASNLKQEQDLLEKSTKIFFEIDEKIRIIIPEALDILSEFLNKLIFSFTIQAKDILILISNAFKHLTSSLGLNSNSFLEIIQEWENDFTTPRFKLEGLDLLKDYRPYESKDSFLNVTKTRMKKEAANIGESTLHKTNAVITKTFHPKATHLNLRHLKIENPVHMSSPEGMFTTAMDPISPDHSLTHSRNFSSSLSTPNGAQSLSPSANSSAWMKPLSLQRSRTVGDNHEVVYDENNHKQETEKRAEISSGSGTPDMKNGKYHQEADEEAMIDHSEDHDTSWMSEEDQNTSSVPEDKVLSLINDIQKLRKPRTRIIDQCPVTINFSESHYDDNDLRFYVAANSSLSAQLLRAHLAN
ncbi:hypothetical protein PACTADRAFT_15652 [Pachysolen tannophilus NRRL Y-2460]|uniref:BAR domain-containing protein n=1 Tax=Pachysolen tannophilus NRRL Y-2460 TaxID=669874 RepID=A0A1E4TZI8_PACTA|nr:hypothetical protein PACTADRAFT_15652 [Pachysolen tannophilus NRRL Y-2460]